MANKQQLYCNTYKQLVSAVYNSFRVIYIGGCYLMLTIFYSFKHKRKTQRHKCLIPNSIQEAKC